MDNTLLIEQEFNAPTSKNLGTHGNIKDILVFLVSRLNYILLMKKLE